MGQPLAPLAVLVAGHLRSAGGGAATALRRALAAGGPADLLVVTHAALSADKADARGRVGAAEGAFYPEGADLTGGTAEEAREAAALAAEFYGVTPSEAAGCPRLAAVAVVNSPALLAAARDVTPQAPASGTRWRYGAKAAMRVAEVATMARAAFERLELYEATFRPASPYRWVLKARPDFLLLRTPPAWPDMLARGLPFDGASRPLGALAIAGPRVSAMSAYQRRLGFNFSDHLAFGSRAAVERYSRLAGALGTLNARGMDVSCVEEVWPAHLAAEGVAFEPSLDCRYKIDRATPKGGIRGAREAWLRQRAQSS